MMLMQPVTEPQVGRTVYLASDLFRPMTVTRAPSGIDGATGPHVSVAFFNDTGYLIFADIPVAALREKRP